MKINGLGSSATEKARDTSATSGAGPTSKSKKSPASSPGSIGGDDNVSISPRAKDVAKAKAAAAGAPDTDEAKIAKLKAAIEGGSYKIDEKAIADKLVDEHLSSGF